MKIPKEVKIGPHYYSVYYQPNLKYDDDMQGALHYRKQTISIEPQIPPSAQDVTFWHEILHGIDINFNTHISEDAVDNLAVGLTQFLQDNFEIELDWSEIDEV